KLENYKEAFDEDDKRAAELVFEKKHKASELSLKITRFSEQTFEVLDKELKKDTGFYASMHKNILELQKGFPIYSLKESGQQKDILAMAKVNTVSSYFKNTTALEALVMLNKIENDVLITENMLVDYIDNITTVLDCGNYEQFSAIISQNSSYLKRGQPLEIYAGVGAFSLSANPTIRINGRKVDVLPDGVAEYQETVSGKPGKHSIPVTIEYTKADGSSSKITKQVQYTVAE
ncbi:MAG: hypothetical protein WCF67_25365, partial [Chitinophagaceae bacterium]